MELSSQFARSTPVESANSIVRFVEQFRNYAITETEMFLALRKRGFKVQAAVDYVELIAGTRSTVDTMALPN